MNPNGWKRWVCWVISIVVSLSYIIFLLTYRSVMGDGIFAFTIIPILVAGSLLGVRGGFWISVILGIFDLSYTSFLGYSLEELFKMPIPVVMTFIILGTMIGRLRDVSVKLRYELSERKRAEGKAEYVAFHDVLTGLPNRACLMEQFAQKDNGLLASREFALLFLDLDRFKWVNDAWGHDYGDELLKVVATRLQSVVGQGSVYRFGGDEFIIILKNVNSEDEVRPTMRTLFDCLKQDVRIKDRAFNISSSVGVVFYPKHGTDIHALLKNADIAMYLAKENGRRTYQFFNPEIAFRVSKRTTIENDLRQAIHRNELVIYYQPILSLETGRIHRVEALVRWNHPEAGLLLPGDFMDVAEETGISQEIDEWMLYHSVLQLKQWHDTGFNQLKLAVNFSVHELHHRQLESDWGSIFKEIEMNPSYIELEITESALVYDEKIAARTMGDLKKRGIRLALDDFGKGYSSLGMMLVYPIDTIKIDRSFIHDVVTDRTSQAIVQAVVGMGKYLRRTIVAVGVETEEQLAYLKAVRCDEVQGFLFSPPVTAEMMAQMLQDDGLKAKESAFTEET